MDSFNSYAKYEDPDHNPTDDITPEYTANCTVDFFRNDLHKGKRTNLNARVAWVRCMEAGIAVPEDVLRVVMDYVSKTVKRDSKPVDTHQEDVLQMLDLALVDYSSFLEIVKPHPQSISIIAANHPVYVLEPIMDSFPEKWEGTDTKLFELFGSLIPDIVHRASYDRQCDAGKLLKDRYRTYKKNKKLNSKLLLG